MDHLAQGPDTNYFKDIAWVKKANPVAAKQEKDFYGRDLFLMEKRRFQKVVQCIQLEE